MSNYFIKQLSYGGVDFRYSKGPSLARGNEIHPYYELLYYVDGDATFLASGIKIKPKAHTLFVIPKESYHNFIIGDQDKYTRMTVSFPEFEQILPVQFGISDIKMIDLGDFPSIGSIIYSMRKCLENTRSEDVKGIYLYGAFLMLLGELCQQEDKARNIFPVIPSDSLAGRCAKYIDSHFRDELEIKKIAQIMHVSSSTLLSSFKNEFGISVHKYVMQRRLVHANKLITQGYKSTGVYLECGYKDYSSFYKAYLKKFGHPPSKTAEKLN